ncbi:hypothetical protein CHH69_13480 [Terribacillus saccharophilus]|uniref:zinc ribbon domain-containing protein n=1 Tax=Terribacillus saccharophilus TaxID=361277 RepID=UPI000BA6CB0B|nr:zinc ribbon domain-containing protein [Terribacillus saccharophilus]PAF18516.1 hypothetical protein CHH51_07300 [Terribacillus saccharophilus]PAF20378.1 hypothetical protein CHH49_16495 [Terribacillus saccharophilus]PAF34873.1 hypothetical protein CHH69_13480 [Terribacillus saccharophilus]PAF35651.1 hypothetical protein CHH58_15650 [Terribacillus saccharophilus]
MVSCPSCGHNSTEESKFCENCGAALEGQTTANTTQSAVTQTQQAASSQQDASGKANEYLETTKKVSKQYFSYFFDVLKRPDGNGMKYGTDNFVNAIITFVLFSLIIPLTLYFQANRQSYFEVPFGEVVVKPVIVFAVFLFIFATIIFGVLKLDQSTASYKSVLVRYGSLLVPFTAIMIVGALFTFIGLEFWGIVLVISGFSFALFIVPLILIPGFKQDRQRGIDNVYLVLIVYVITSIVLGIMFSMLVDSLQYSDFGNLFY